MTDPNLWSACRDEPPPGPLPAEPDPERDAPCAILFVIDSRACVRDSIVTALRAHRAGDEIRGFHDVEACAKHCADGGARPTLLILACHALGPCGRESSWVVESSTMLDAHRTVALVDVLDGDVLQACARHQLDGVVPSSYSTGQILSCIDAVLSGAHLLPMECLDTAGADLCGGTPTIRAASAIHGTLTPRQRQVLELVIEGRSNKYIAIELSLAESTVKVHVSELLRRLGATSRTHAAFLVNRAAGRAPVSSA